tara:strand:+ start:371 stop:676 length:306 start_codon:yes stop_codon:yes gene_type:complete
MDSERHLEDVNQFVHLVETLGFPIFMSGLLIFVLYLMLRWMMNILLSKIQSLWDMIVKLIDRVRALDNSLVRLETMIRLMKEIDPDWERIGKLDPEDRRKD